LKTSTSRKRGHDETRIGKDSIRKRAIEELEQNVKNAQSLNQILKQRLTEVTSNTDRNVQTFTNWEIVLKDTMTTLLKDRFPHSHDLEATIPYDDLDQTMTRMIQQQTAMEQHYDGLVANLRLDSTQVRSKLETLEHDLDVLRQDRDQLRQDYEKEWQVGIRCFFESCF
jgi:hypothetical protein